MIGPAVLLHVSYQARWAIPAMALRFAIPTPFCRRRAGQLMTIPFKTSASAHAFTISPCRKGASCGCRVHQGATGPARPAGAQTACAIGENAVALRPHEKARTGGTFLPDIPERPFPRMTPRPQHPPWVAKFRSVPSWTGREVFAPRMRCRLRSRWAARMAPFRVARSCDNAPARRRRRGRRKKRL